MRYILTTLLLSILIISACSNGEDTFNIELATDITINNETIEFNKNYELNGATVSFLAANFYIGGLELSMDDNSTIDLVNNYYLAGIDRITTVVGDFPISNIAKIDYFIGVDPTNNAQTEQDFTSRLSNDPLGIQDPAMHWNWNTGYKFLRVDGEVDTDGDGTVDTPIAYHIGSNPLLTNLSQGTYNIDGGKNTMTFTLDLNEFFKGVDLKTEVDTHTGNNLPLAERLVANMATAITVK